MVTRRQHYVWRHYLKMWQGKDGLVACLRDQKIFWSNPTNTMVEKDFYKLQKLTREDIFILQEFVKKTTSLHLRNAHKALIAKFALIAEVNERLQVDPKASSADREIARKLVLEAEEMLHCGVEENAQPILNALRNKDGNVIYSDDDSAISFFHFISQQFFRTKSKHDVVMESFEGLLPAENARRIQNLICHCFATNIGGSLYCDRHGFEIIFLDCPAGSEFITGDQPVVNILTNRDGRPPEELAFYYPLSPNLAMILAPKSLELGAILTKFDIEATNELNDFIACESRHFLIASSPDQLKRYKLKSYGAAAGPLSFLPDIR